MLLIGIGNGAIYAHRLGLGLVVIYRTTGLLNFAAGEMAMFSTFIMWTFTDSGCRRALAMFGGMVGRLPASGALIERRARPTGRRSARATRSRS